MVQDTRTKASRDARQADFAFCHHVCLGYLQLFYERTLAGLFNGCPVEIEPVLLIDWGVRIRNGTHFPASAQMTHLYWHLGKLFPWL
jgi:hypothetical protein